MSPIPNHSTLKRYVNIVLAAFCLVWLWLPTLDTFFHFDHTPPFNEKRELAKLPQIKYGLVGLKKYAAGLDAYFNDHFGCRNRLILWHTKWTHDFLRSSRVPKVLIGKDGWLYWAGDQMAEHYQGVNQFTPQELVAWKTLLENRRDWLAQRGIKYIFTVAPDKQSIYPEYLPDWMTKERPDTKLDQLFAYMRAYSSVAVLDLRPALREGKLTAPTYFQNDTHWNSFGGFLACQEIAKSLSKELPGIQPLSLASFELKNTPGNFGDLAMFLGMNLTENKAVYLYPKKSLPVLQMSEQLEDKHGCFYSINSAASDGAMVFRDSFAFFMEPFLGYHFGRVDYIWSQRLSMRLIEQKKTIVVISEIVERDFNVRNPKEMMRLDVWK